MNYYQSLFIFVFSGFSISCYAQQTGDVLKKMNGLSFVASNRQLSSEDIIPALHTNANWIALMPYGFMPSASSPNLYYDTPRQWWGETAAGIKATASLFQEKKIHIMLKPQIWVKRGVFTGTIEMNSENDWMQLEKNYRNFILHFAKIAHEENIELFCLGTELKLFVANRPEFWFQLIEDIKQVYKGKITYAANWDSYDLVPFWKEIDLIGIDAYFPLSDSKTATVVALEKAWSPLKGKLKNYSLKHQKSIIFTEYGYRSIDCTTAKPWDASSKGNYNPLAQGNALKALYSSFWAESWFAGGFLWKWFDNQTTAGGKSHTGYTVQNKKTETIVKNFYQNQKLVDE